MPRKKVKPPKSVGTVPKEAWHVVSKKTNCAKKYYQMYLNLFDIQNGKYLFQYLYAFELFEIILQYLSFNSLCTDGNLQYIVLVLSLITINVMVSPILLVCRKKFGKNAKLIVTSFMEDCQIFRKNE